MKHCVNNKMMDTQQTPEWFDHYLTRWSHTYLWLLSPEVTWQDKYDPDVRAFSINPVSFALHNMEMSCCATKSTFHHLFSQQINKNLYFVIIWTNQEAWFQSMLYVIFCVFVWGTFFTILRRKCPAVSYSLHSLCLSSDSLLLAVTH